MSDEALPVLFSFGGVDGGPRVEVSVADDEMTAWGTFYPSTSTEGKLLVWSEFSEALENSGLSSCALEREIQDALFRFNTGRPSPERIVIARGHIAVAERPAFLKLEPQFYDHHFQDKGGVQVDFKEFSPFVIVKNGELLARGILPREGKSGMTVRGTEIAPGKKEIKHLKPGPHTLFAHGKVFSRLAGRFTLEGDVFDVSDTLELDAGVGYGTGNLIFPGSIVVKGVVSDGFRLAAGQGITVKGPLDASEVMCHGDLLVEGGIIGKKPGIVRVGGSVKTLFVEHCRLEALGKIHVVKALLHAQVCTNSDLVLDDSGRIVATTAWVKGNITCGQLGGENGPVRIVAGKDFVIQRKLDHLKAKHESLEQEISKETTKTTAPSPEKVAALQALVDEVNELTPQLFGNPGCQVRVSGRVFEGTVIEMGFATLTVTKEIKGQVYSLSPDGKTIVSAASGKEAKPAKDSKPSAPVAE